VNSNVQGISSQKKRKPKESEKIAIFKTGFLRQCPNDSVTCISGKKKRKVGRGGRESRKRRKERAAPRSPWRNHLVPKIGTEKQRESWERKEIEDKKKNGSMVGGLAPGA